MITVVQKAFSAGGETLAPGAIVDSTTWRNEQALLDSRYLRKASADETASLSLSVKIQQHQTQARATRADKKLSRKKLARA